eukprot:292296-Rhodomonas_salina.1
MAMHADMEAQRFCEQLYQAIILIFSSSHHPSALLFDDLSVAGFIVGYWMESFRITVYAVFGGVCIASAICVPDWGIFRGTFPVFLSLGSSFPRQPSPPFLFPSSPRATLPVSPCQHPFLPCRPDSVCSRFVSCCAGKDPPVWLPEGITKRPAGSGIKAAEEKKDS